jgi:transcriptional regulator with XRE-family HTH domain
MPRAQDVDATTRVRIRKWLAYYKARRGWTNERLAKELDLAIPTVTNILNDKRSAGLDVVIKMHRRLHKTADDILDTDPPSD